MDTVHWSICTDRLTFCCLVWFLVPFCLLISVFTLRFWPVSPEDWEGFPMRSLSFSSTLVLLLQHTLNYLRRVKVTATIKPVFAPTQLVWSICLPLPWAWVNNGTYNWAPRYRMILLQVQGALNTLIPLVLQSHRALDLLTSQQEGLACS